jgi:phosphoribosylglycinamide formyltransferase-1
VTLRLGVLVSGSGSNLQAILDAIATGTLDAEVCLVVSNKAGVRALDRARDAGVRAIVLSHKDFTSREAYDEQLVACLREAKVEWIALAGFMRILTPVFLSAFPNRVVNIHPSLLPAFPGTDAQKQAFDYGVKVAGCTVHFVDGGVDSGPIILQNAVPVLDNDTAESLRLRILDAEHVAFVEGLRRIAAGRISLGTTESGRLKVITTEGS